MAASKFKEHFEYTDFIDFYLDTTAEKKGLSEKEKMSLESQQDCNGRRPSLTNTLDTLSTASLSSLSTIHKKQHNNRTYSNTIAGWCLRQKAKINRFRQLI